MPLPRMPNNNDEPAVDVLEQPEEASQPPSTTTATV
jgi:hypothetical protein